MRLNIHDEEARELLSDLDFRFTPTFILFDAQSREVWRSIGSLNADEVKGIVSKLNQLSAEG